MRGREHPIVLPDALHVIMMFPWCSRLCIRLPQRDAYPSGCDGIQIRYGLLAKPWPVDLRPHPTILFSGLPAGESDPVAGGRTPCCWLGTSDSRGARPEPPINAGVTTRALCTQGISHCLHRCCRRAGRTSPKLARYHCNQGNFPCPGTGYRRFFSPPLRLNLRQKRAKPFNSASVQERYHDPAFHRIRFRSMNKSIPILG